MTSKSSLIYILSVSVLLLFPGCKSQKDSTIDGKTSEVVPFRALPFEINQVRLLEGMYLQATELNENILLDYIPDRFLARFRTEAGLEPRAEHYHGWEDNTIAGHSLGHYMTAISLMYETTGKEEFRQRANYIVDELALCQETSGNGYFGAFPDGKRILEEEVARGDIRSHGFDLNGIWVPYYTQHKILDGLMHVYRTFENEQALNVALGLADWIGTVVENLDEVQVQRMLDCEHGGMNEVLAELYGITGEEKYLELSRIFHHKKILDPITAGEDILAGKHSNTQIPKFIGLARRYELTGDSSDRAGAENFWNMMVHHHSYVTGGNGNYEYLSEPDKLNDQLSDNTTESCNVYNMLKLSEHIFSWTGDPEVLDFYERALLNHIRSSQHPHDGHVIYNLSLDMGGFKVYEDPESFTCCVGSGMESHSKYSRNIYYHNEDELFLTQFISSELTWQEKGLKLTQKTGYPESEDIRLEFNCETPVQLQLNIRYPKWAEKGISVVVNGKEMKVKTEPGSFIPVSRKWETGDMIEIHIPFFLRTESMPDNPSRIAIFNGPVVLAADLGPVPDSASGNPLYVPVLMTKDPDPSNWLEPVPGEFNTFRTTSVAFPRTVELFPFYRTHDRHYTIYWDTYTEDEWKEHQLQEREANRRMVELESRTLDLFRPGEMQPERNHNFMESRTWIGEYKSKKYREADRGGWFSFEMKIPEEGEAALVAEYWGGFTGSKTFYILVDGHIIATENIAQKAPGEFIHITYPIPGELMQGKEKITVKFLPHEGHRAGPIFSMRTIHINQQDLQ